MHHFSKTFLFALCLGLVGKSVAFSANGGALSSRLSIPGLLKIDRPRCVAKKLRMQEQVNVADGEPTPVKTTESKPKSTPEEANFYAKVDD
jgi:hypothetical protein